MTTVQDTTPEAGKSFSENPARDFDRIPQDLKDKTQWALFELTWNPEKKKYEKKPINAKANDSTTWRPFKELVSRQRTNQTELTYCLSAEPEGEQQLIVIDLDHIVGEDGQWSPAAETVMALFKGTYMEASVSGDGAHIFVSGKTDLRPNSVLLVDGVELPVEIYSDKRFIIMTGWAMEEVASNEILHMQESLDALASLLKPSVKTERALVKKEAKASGYNDSEIPLHLLKQALPFLSAEEYGTWFRILVALKRWGEKTNQEDTSWELFDEWSQSTTAGNYDKDKNMDAWDNVFLHADDNKPFTAASILYLAKKNGCSLDYRGVTSPANGKAGGRPPAPPHAKTAYEFYEGLVCAESGQPNLRHVNQEWWAYQSTGWSCLLEEDIKKSMTKFMQDNAALKDHVTANYMNSFVMNLKSENYCGKSVSLGSWISQDGEVESGKNWMAFADDVVVNVWNFAEELGKGNTPDLNNSDIFRKKSAGFFSKSYVGYNFDAGANKACPLFEEYLETVLPNPDSRKMLQQMAGYLLSDEMRFQKMFFLTGSGANGKSVFDKILTALVDAKNVSRVEPHMMAEKHSTWPLTENKVNITGDLSLYGTGKYSVELIEGVLKQVTSGDALNVEKKYQHGGAKDATVRLLFCANQMPPFKDKTNAIKRRTQIIHFPVFISPEKQDSTLDRKIIDGELPGILCWALEGLAEVVKNGSLFESEESKGLVEEHFLSCDKEGEFLRSHCCADSNEFAGSTTLYKAYQSWCSDNGCRALSISNFKSSVMRVFPEVKCCTGKNSELLRVRGFKGLQYLGDNEGFDSSVGNNHWSKTKGGVQANPYLSVIKPPTS